MSATQEKYDLDQKILKVICENGDWNFTIRQAVEGVQIFGGIGSGKTSGSGRTLALSYLDKGFGGLVLTVKPDEKDQWIEYCKMTGRSDDLVIIGPNHKNRFNFLEYESAQSETGKTYTENIAQVLKTVIQAAQAKDMMRGSDDGFWEQALDMLIFNIIDLCQLAYGQITIERMYDIAQTIPKFEEPAFLTKDDWISYQEEMAERGKSPRELTPFEEAMIAAHTDVTQAIHKYKNANAEHMTELMGGLSFSEFIKKKFPKARTYFYIRQFFMESYRGLYEKTRSIIDFTFSGFMFRLLRDPAFSLFCEGKSTVKPEDSLNGKIILIDLDVKSYHKVGRDCQILFKYIWQRAMEKRNIAHNDRPVFLWADEAQNFLHEHDPVFQATARSSRIATVYITQNLPNYFAAMGGQNGHAKVSGFLGTMATKFFHANADIETNRYASDLVGQMYFEKMDRGITASESFSASRNISINLEQVFRPEDFVTLRGGSAMNNFCVEAIAHRQGDPVIAGKNYGRVLFHQQYHP